MVYSSVAAVGRALSGLIVALKTVFCAESVTARSSVLLQSIFGRVQSRVRL